MKKRVFSLILVFMLLMVSLTGCASLTDIDEVQKETMSSLYGVNEGITGEYDKTLAAKCYNGTFVGKEENEVISYKGIPYAETPTGELRWKEPVAASASDKVYEAYYFGKTPIQTEINSERASSYEQGEDCLTLNVWTSEKTSSSDKAVMVFIHGGSYGWGGTSDPLYDGQNFVEAHDDIVLVSIEYRVGMMGFIDFSSVKGGENFSTSGNLGLLDQIAALQWIKNNIEAFGGNPDNVTIFGESAGGGSVSLLPLIDEAKGLFNRIIAQSGSVALTFSKDECQNLTEMLMEKTGATSMEDLQALSEEEIMEVNEELNDYNNFPERDGIVIPEDLYQAYADGVSSDIDMLIGTTSDEARYWMSEMGGLTKYTLSIPILYENNLKRISDEDMAYVKQFMSLQTERKVWNITEFYNEIMFRIPAILQASSHAENGGNAYMYYWTYPSAIGSYGACHAVELAYVFNNLDETKYTGDNIKTELAETVQQMWVNYAKTGNPSTDTITWPQYNSDTRATMILGDEIKVENDILSQQREAITKLIKYDFNGSYVNLSLNVPHVYKLVGISITVLFVLVGSFIFIHIRRKKQKENSMQ